MKQNRQNLSIETIENAIAKKKSIYKVIKQKPIIFLTRDQYEQVKEHLTQDKALDGSIRIPSELSNSPKEQNQSYYFVGKFFEGLTNEAYAFVRN